jgi:lysophospholipase L1-like esterase
VYGLLLGQTKLARHRIGEPEEDPVNADGVYGSGADPVTLAVLGDSAAAGFGVGDPRLTTGARIAAGLAESLGRPVALRSLAVVGAQSGDLADQILQLQPDWPTAAVIIVGANDVTHRVPPGRSVALLTDAIRELSEHGVRVVVGTCPDLGTVRPIPHPLRFVARRWSRSLSAAQLLGAVEAGARAVALADLLGPEFEAHPDRLFGPDRFHPSAEGYAALAAALVPSLVDTLTGEPVESPDTTSLDLAHAAATAAEVGGAEVSADSRSRLRGLLRLRRPAPVHEVPADR